MHVFAKLSKRASEAAKYRIARQRNFLTVAQTRMHLCQKVETHEKYSKDMLVCQQQTEVHEPWRAVRDSVRWEMAVEPHPSRKRSSEFSMESANDKIRARPFRHTKFQDVSARLRTPPIRGASGIRSLPRR